MSLNPDPDHLPGASKVDPSRARMGLGVSLLLAFFGISGFAVLAAIAAIYSFTAVGNLMDEITEHQVPSALASLELSRQSERIANLAPALLNAATPAEHAPVEKRIGRELTRLQDLLKELEKRTETEVGADEFVTVARAAAGLEVNLAALNAAISGRLLIRKEEEDLQKELLATHTEIRKLLDPWLLIVDAEIAELKSTVKDLGLPDKVRADAGARLEISHDHAGALRRARLLATDINDRLLQASNETNADRLDVAVFRLKRAILELEAVATNFDKRLQPLLKTQTDTLRDLVLTSGGIPEVRKTELRFVNEARLRLSENTELAAQLSGAVDQLVDVAKSGIADARARASSAQSLSTTVLYVIVSLAVISSILIVWLYVGRQIVRRLVLLSESMKSIADGKLESPIPSGGKDEISRMAAALEVFRDTAIEVRESNLREIREARRRLTDAIESISEGFALFDPDDKLVVCNRNYKDLYPGLGDLLEPGVLFPDIAEGAIDRGLVKVEPGQRDRVLGDRLKRHKTPEGAFLQRQTDGRWIQISERRTNDGGCVAVYTDVTDLKGQQVALSKAKIEAEDALAELKKAQTSLVQSEKLALLGQLAAGIAHEIKNPLNFVGNFADVSIDLLAELRETTTEILQELPTGERANAEALLSDLSSNLRRIVEHSRRADQIVVSMLAHSRGASEERRELDVNQLVKDSLNLAYHGARATDRSFNVTQDVQLDPKTGRVSGNPQDLTRVLLNLLSNAFYATRKRAKEATSASYEPTVVVRTSGDAETVQISIRDNGTGVPKELQSKVFTPFFTTKPAGEGTGLGLSLSFDIVTHRYGGRLTMVSGDNQGSEFTIVLPRQTAETKAPGPRSKEDHHAAQEAS